MALITVLISLILGLCFECSSLGLEEANLDNKPGQNLKP